MRPSAARRRRCVLGFGRPRWRSVGERGDACIRPGQGDELADGARSFLSIDQQLRRGLGTAGEPSPLGPNLNVGNP